MEFLRNSGIILDFSGGVADCDCDDGGSAFATRNRTGKCWNRHGSFAGGRDCRWRCLDCWQGSKRDLMVSKSRTQAKLGAWALIALLMPLPFVGRVLRGDGCAEHCGLDSSTAECGGVS